MSRNIQTIEIPVHWNIQTIKFQYPEIFRIFIKTQILRNIQTIKIPWSTKRIKDQLRCLICFSPIRRDILMVLMCKWAGTREKEPYGLPVCDSSNTHAWSPIWATDMRFCLKLPHGLYYMSANSKDSGETALMRRLAWAFAWSPLW